MTINSIYDNKIVVYIHKGLISVLESCNPRNLNRSSVRIFAAYKYFEDILQKVQTDSLN